MRMIHSGMAGLALCAGLLAGLLGSATPPLADDEVSAPQLARWIAERRPGLRVLDLRGPAAFDRDHVPGAAPLAQWPRPSTGVAETLVVYSEHVTAVDAVPAGIADRDRPRVLRLHGGWRAWSEEVLFPTLRHDASAAERRAFAEQARLSRYFGGAPRVLAPGIAASLPRSRRGC